MTHGESRPTLRRRRLTSSAMLPDDRPLSALTRSGSGSHIPLLREDPASSGGSCRYRQPSLLASVVAESIQAVLIILASMVLCVVLIGPSLVNPSAIHPNGLSNVVDQRRRLPSGDTSFQVLSLNTFMRPALVGMWDYQVERMPLIVDAVASYGIAATQEMFWMSGRKKDFLDALRQRDVPWYAAAPMPGVSGLLRWPPKLIDGGLTITSEFPIVESDFIIYDASVPQSIDFIVAKGALYAKIMLSGNTSGSSEKRDICLHMFTTHAQANNGLDPQAFEIVRYRQMSQLSEFVLSKTTSGSQRCPVIIGGDFNVDARASAKDPRSSQEYNQTLVKLEKQIPGLSDLLFESRDKRHPVTSAGGLDGSTQKNERLDYIFFAKSPAVPEFRPSQTIAPAVHKFFAPKGSPVKTASDHFGVSAAFDYL